MTPEAWFSLLAPFLMGWALLFWLLPFKIKGGSQVLLGIGLSVGLGLGFTSCGFFLWLLAAPPSKGDFLIWAAALMALVLALGWLLRSGKELSWPEGIRTPASDLKIQAYLLAGLGILIALSAAVFYFRLQEKPHGSVDAWLFWNMRARFLFRAGEHWRDAFLPHLVNPSYPLMLPSAIAAIWSGMEKEWMMAPKWVAACYTAATVALLGGALALLRGLTQSLIAVIALLSLSSFVIRGASQVSDVPLGFYFLATLASLSLYDRLSQKNTGLLVLAGAMAGFSAWTKNEGLLFVLVLVLGRSLTVGLFRGWKASLKEMIFLGAGLAPVLSLILYFKWNIAAPNDLVAAAKDPDFVLEKVSTASRYGEISLFYLKTLFLSGSVTLLNPLVYLIVFALCFKVRILPEFKLNILFTAAVLASMLLGYYTVHLLVPYDLHFYLEHSLTRLLIQLWPSFLLLFFTAVRTPEEARGAAR